MRLTAQSFEWLHDHKILLGKAGRQRLAPGDVLTFLADVEVEPYVGFYAGDTICRMGFMSFTGSPVHRRMSVGRYCSIAHGVSADFHRHPIEHLSTSTFTHDPFDPLRAAFLADEGADLPIHPNPQRPPAQIGHDVWIGAGAMLMPGVSIGTGAVVAAGSVVTKSVAPYEIVGGDPARPIRKRFADELAARLLASEWWLYKFTDFAGLALDDPARFLEGFEARKPGLEPYRPPLIRLADMPQ